jgi:hypothetical protein
MPAPTIHSASRSNRNPNHSSRLFIRRPLDLRARLVALLATGEHVIVHARTRDLSHSGAGLTLTSELPSGTSVVLCLRLPAGGQLCMQAVIARQRGFRAGLQFVRPTAEQRLLLSELCFA